MVEIVSGGLLSSKSNYLYRKIEKNVQEKKQVLVLAPDQFNFESDKRLYNFLGTNKYNKIVTLGFNRLPEFVCEKYEKGISGIADDMTACMEMYKATRKYSLAESPKYYTRTLGKPNIINQMLTVVSQLISEGITPQMLEISMQKLSRKNQAEENENSEEFDFGQTVVSKLYDICRVYENYLEILKEDNLTVGESLLDFAAALIDEYGFFKNMCVYVDEFNRFTLAQQKIIKLAVRDAENFCISLTINNLNTAPITPFSESLMTDKFIKNTAKQYGRNYNVIDVSGSLENKSPAMSHIDNNIYNSIPDKINSQGNAQIIACGDKYSECVCVCRKIASLIKTGKYKFSEIAISARELTDYEFLLKMALNRFDLPYFFDVSKGGENSALTMFVLACLDMLIPCRKGGFLTSKVIKVAKSYLFDCGEEDVFLLEQFVLKWGIDGKLWLEDFNPVDDPNIDRINALRKKIIEPAVKFRENSSDATAGRLAENLLVLLNDYNICEVYSKTVGEFAESAKQTEIEASRELKQLWKIFSDALTCIHDFCDDQKISINEFSELVKVIMSSGELSQPPQIIDSVICADAVHSRLTGIKAVFVLGLNEGVMPATVSSQGLLSDYDKGLLEKTLDGKIIEQNTKRLIDAERTNVYYALCCSSERLVCTYSSYSSDGKKLNPSMLVKNLSDMFEDNIISNFSDTKDIDYCTDYKSAYFRYIENMDNNNEQIKIIKSALQTDPVYRKKLEDIDRLKNQTAEIKISSEIAKKLLFKNGAKISASQAESYYGCPLQYFVRYGLGIKTPEKIEINSRIRGNLVHFCLEHIMSKNKQFDKAFLTASDSELKKRLVGSANDYKQEKLGGDFSKNQRFEYLFSQVVFGTWSVVKSIRDELSSSSCHFVPEEFEYKLQKNSLVINTCGVEVEIVGSIDRVDVIERGGKKYLRVVDYKTGSKDINFEQIYYGINLQMLIYLLAISTDKNGEFIDEVIPTGVVYMPSGAARDTKLSAAELEKLDKQQLQKELDRQVDDFYKRSGLAVNFAPTGDEKQDEFNSEVYTDMAERFKSNPKNNPLNSVEIFERVLKFAEYKIEKMIKNLCDGDVSPNTISDKRYSKCDYCDYTSICRLKPNSETKLKGTVGASKEYADKIIDGEEKKE